MCVHVRGPAPVCLVGCRVGQECSKEMRDGAFESTPPGTKIQLVWHLEVQALEELFV